MTKRFWTGFFIGMIATVAGAFAFWGVDAAQSRFVDDDGTAEQRIRLAVDGGGEE